MGAMELRPVLLGTKRVVEMSAPQKPEAPELCYVYVRQIFDQLDKARATMRRAMDQSFLKNPSHALWYRDTIDSLHRLEAQADALSYAFQMTREDLRQWMDATLAYYKKLGAAA